MFERVFIDNASELLPGDIIHGKVIYYKPSLGAYRFISSDAEFKPLYCMFTVVSSIRKADWHSIREIQAIPSLEGSVFIFDTAEMGPMFILEGNRVHRLAGVFLQSNST